MGDILHWLIWMKFISMLSMYVPFETYRHFRWRIIVVLTHWGRVTHICVGKLTIIGSDNGLSPGRRKATIWTNAGILLIEPLGTKFSEILIGIQIFSFTKMLLKKSSAKWRPFCLGLNVLTQSPTALVFVDITGAHKLNWKYVETWLFVTASEQWPPGKISRVHTMTLSNGNIFCFTGHLCGEFIGHRWIPRTKASDAELWCFLWSVPE